MSLFKAYTQSLNIIAFCLVSAIIYIIKQQDLRGKFYTILSICLIYGASYLHNINYNPTLESGSKKIKAEIVNILAKKSQYRNYFQIKLKDSTGAYYQLYLDSLIYQVGDVVEIDGKLKEVKSPGVPGGFNYRKYLKSQNIKGVFNPRKTKINILEKKNVSLTPFNKLTKSITESIAHSQIYFINTFEKLYGESYSGILLALFLGIKNELPSSFSENFRQAGLFHILAISGFHVGLISLIIVFILKIMRFNVSSANLISIVILWIYIPLSGNSDSVKRAVIMFSVFNIAAIFKRQSFSLNNLGIAGCIILLWHPQSLFSLGFQLSFIASAAIIYLNPLGKKILNSLSINKHIKAIILNPLLITLWATIGTSYYMINVFHWFAPITFLGTLLIVPLISLAMLSAILSMFLNGIISGIVSGILSTSMLDYPLEFNPFIATTKLLLYLSDLITLKINSIPGAGFNTSSLSMEFWIIFYFLVVIIGHTLLKPQIDSKLKKLILIVMLIASSYFCYLKVSAIFNPVIRVTFIDVGQGDATLIQFPGDINFLIDTGNSNRYQDAFKSSLKPFFIEKGIDHLDALIITHSDADHYAATIDLIDFIPIKTVYSNFLDLESYLYQSKKKWHQVISKAQDKNIKIKGLYRGHIFKGKNWILKTLNPDKSLEYTTANNASLVFSLSYFKKDVLLLNGDLEKEKEKELLDLKLVSSKIPYFKAGHHGSKTSNQLSFLDKVNPEFIFISAGHPKIYRHPSPEVIENIKDLDIDYANTHTHGSLFLTIEKDTSYVSTFNDSKN